MAAMEYDPTGDLGIGIVRQRVNGDLQWMFREQAQSDFGIDAHIEVVRKSKVTGQLIALQIKCGKSYLKPNGQNDFTFYPKSKHDDRVRDSNDTP